MTTSPYLLAQFAPLRIDHHGWQIAMAGLTLLALLDRNAARSGLVAGIAVGFWTHVSIEGLPYLVLVGALLGVRYIRDRREEARLVAYLGSLAAASVLFFAATKAPNVWLAARCDSMSAPYLAPFVLAAGLVAGGSRFARLEGAVHRAGLLGVAGLAAVLALALAGPDCLAGPFAALDPLVHRVWYENVAEGRPLWVQQGYLAVGLLWPALIGGIGTWVAWRTSRAPEEARRWGTFATLFAGAFVLSVLVFRAQGIAHLYAMIGCAALLQALLARLRSVKPSALRIPLTVLAVALPSPIPAGEGTAYLQMNRAQREQLKASLARGDCASAAGLAGLARRSGTLVLAPLDLGPAMLVFTPHSVVASGYHRNGVAMHDVITAFSGTAGQAEDVVRRHGAAMLAYCRDRPEVELYQKVGPRGFMAQLERGRVPAWLEPMRVAGSPDLRVYRIRPAR